MGNLTGGGELNFKRGVPGKRKWERVKGRGKRIEGGKKKNFSGGCFLGGVGAGKESRSGTPS